MQTTDRAAMHFAQAVEANFGFLFAHGFERTESSPTYVRFESDHVELGVYHGARSFELGLEVGPPARRDEAPYAMSEIIRLVEPNRPHEYRNFSARDPDAVREGVCRLAALVRPYVDAGLFDDPTLLERLEKQRQAWKTEFADDVKLKQARRRLDAAWSAREFAEVVALLRPLRHLLTPAELHKLEYAEIHISRRIP